VPRSSTPSRLPHYREGVTAVVPPAQHVLFHVLLALVVIVGAARACGALVARLHQPPVMGEVLAGAPAVEPVRS
jgi:hypothetical protein